MFAKRYIFLLLALVALATACASVPREVRQNYDAERQLAAYEREGVAAKDVVIVDIDDTIMRFRLLDVFRLAVGLRCSTIPQIAGAAQGLRALQQRWHVVILTARDDFFQRRTLRWLQANGFPSAPVIFSPRFHPFHEKQEEFKTEAIRRLRARGFNPVIGIGDSTVDWGAGLANQMRVFIVLNGSKDSVLSEIRREMAKDPNVRQRSDLLSTVEGDSSRTVWENLVRQLGLETPRDAEGGAE